MRSFRFAVAATFLSTAPLAAQGWIVPRPCVNCQPTIARTRSDVRAELTNGVLRYTVEERFVNRGARVGEADYLFPLPANAAFQDLQLEINGELVGGETMAADTARRIYENIVRASRDPALVEWMGHGLLRARIFPIAPGEEKSVVVRFQSVAPREGDALRVDYFRGGNQQTGTQSFTLTYAGLGQAYSPTHGLDFTERNGRRVVSVRGDARDLTLLIPVPRSSSAAITMLPYAPGSEDGFALITVTPPPVVRGESTPRDVTLVLDVSGSMAGKKMEQARAAGHQLLGTLRPNDRFRLIDFSTDVRTFANDFAIANPQNIREAHRVLDGLEANGGTNIEGALREAVRAPVTPGRLPLILFITDGEASVGERQPDRLAAIAADPQRRIFTFGLGSDVNVTLLEQLAMDGRGTAEFVRPDESVERAVSQVANRLVDPVLTDVRVRIDGNVRFSRLLPTKATDVFADRDLILFTRYSGHGEARITVEGNQRGTPVTWTTTVNFPERERENPFVGRLWAAQRIGFLSAEKRRNGSQEFDQEIRTLGERFGIPTEFTSYLVQEPRPIVMPTAGLQAQVGQRAPESKATSAARDRSVAFEAARMASAQRAAGSVAMVDSLRRADASSRQVDGRTFTLRDGVWTDQRYASKLQTIRIKPFSKAYFDLVNALPELRAVFALGDRVIVAGRDRAIVLADDGAATLDAAALATLVKAW